MNLIKMNKCAHYHNFDKTKKVINAVTVQYTKSLCTTEKPASFKGEIAYSTSILLHFNTILIFFGAINIS